MPYTPPALRSPASSAPPSPEVSRRSSFLGTSPTTSRPTLPKSTSYLTKHRRTPSAPGALSTHHAWHPTPEATSEDLKHMVVVSPSVRQSPPPVTDANAMPKGAMISPPDSSSDPEDDEGTQPEIRGRRIGNLKELQDAISQIPQHREGSPEKAECAIDDSTPVTGVSADADPGDLISTTPRPKGLAEGFHHSFSTGTLDQLVAQQRRISHARSLTEPSFELTKSPGTSLAGSDEESDEEVMRKPQMVRKKSGELVRPALRPPSRRRPSSMPGTPTFSNKAVHFDSHLEHVRHFLQVDRPLAVSAGSSPIDNYESDSEYPWDNNSNNNNKQSAPRTSPHEWEIIVCNFPAQTAARKNLLVRLERVWVSPDHKSLVGTVAVANLAFQKSVVCRFTLDYWKTVSEVAAEYVCEIVPRETPFSHDRFQFTIKLSDLANLESKTLYFCVRYNTNGQEMWDNNDGTNFQADFRKKVLSQNGKKGTMGAASRPVNSLPRSNRRANPSAAPRPQSMPAGSLDDFNASNKVNFEQSIHDYLGESESTPLRLKSKPPTNLASDNLAGRLTAPSGQAFANRYDFGASLTAAVQAAKDAMVPRPDGFRIQSLPRRVAGPNVKLSIRPSAEASTSASEYRTAAVPAKPAPAPKRLEAPKGKPAVPVVTRPGPLAAVPGSPSAAIASSSYEELVNKYCFFNSSKQSSPPLKDGTLRDGRFDGPDEIPASQSPASASSSNTGSTSSSGNGSPVQMGQFVGRGRQPPSHSKPFAFGEPQHLTSPIKDTNPYFQHAAALMSSLGPSPAESPLMGLAVQRTSSPLQARSSPVSSQVGAGSSATPVAAARSYGPPYGASPPGDFSHMHDRFPFFGADAHAATAIRG